MGETSCGRDARPTASLCEWQIEEIKKAIAEADGGEFAPDEVAE